MKKFAGMIAGFALFAGTAMAGAITLEFAGDDGATQVWTLDDATQTATYGETTDIPYTYDEATMTLCATPESGEICVTFESGEREVGSSTAYTVDDGRTGTATVTAVAE